MNSSALAHDPIMKFYLRMAESTEYETHMPVFSETSLRLAFKQVLAKYRPFESFDLLLYRELLLLYYAESYQTVDDLLTIMTCFDELAVVTYLDRTDEIMGEWQTFTAKNLKNVIYKEAFFEIMEEWTRRYKARHGKINEEQLREKAIEIKTILFWDGKMIKQWLKSFVDMVRQGIVPKAQKAPASQSSLSLSIRSIFNDIRPKLHPFLIERVQGIVDNIAEYNEEPVAKKAKRSSKKLLLDIQLIEPSSGDESGDGVNGDSAENGGAEYLIKVESCPDSADDDQSQCDSVNGKTRIEIDSDGRDQSDESDDTSTDHDETEVKIIDYDTALSYISSLQAYAAINGHFDAIDLLDTVDSAFRKNKPNSN